MYLRVKLEIQGDTHSFFSAICGELRRRRSLCWCKRQSHMVNLARQRAPHDRVVARPVSGRRSYKTLLSAQPPSNSYRYTNHHRNGHHRAQANRSKGMYHHAPSDPSDRSSIYHRCLWLGMSPYYIVLSRFVKLFLCTFQVWSLEGTLQRSWTLLVLNLLIQVTKSTCADVCFIHLECCHSA